MLLFVVTFAWSRRLKKTNKRTVLLGYRDECSEVSLMWKMIGLLLVSVAVIQWQCRLRSLVVTSSFCYFFLCNLLSSKCPIVSYLVCGLRQSACHALTNAVEPVHPPCSRVCSLPIKPQAACLEHVHSVTRYTHYRCRNAQKKMKKIQHCCFVVQGFS